MIKNPLTLVIFALCCFSESKATIISLVYTGTVTQEASQPLYLNSWTANYGDRVIGLMLIDANTPQQLINPTHAFYEGAILTWTIILDGTSVRRATSNFVRSDLHVLDDEPTQVYDRYFIDQWNDSADTSIFLNGALTPFQSASGWELDLLDMKGTAIDSLEMPVSIDPDSFGLVHHGVIGDGFSSFAHSIDHILLTRHGGSNHVPDAGSTLTLLGMAFGGLGFIRHRI